MLLHLCWDFCLTSSCTVHTVAQSALHGQNKNQREMMREDSQKGGKGEKADPCLSFWLLGEEQHLPLPPPWQCDELLAVLGNGKCLWRCVGKQEVTFGNGGPICLFCIPLQTASAQHQQEQEPQCSAGHRPCSYQKETGNEHRSAACRSCSNKRGMFLALQFVPAFLHNHSQAGFAARPQMGSLFPAPCSETGLGLWPHLVPSLHELHPGVNALDGVHCVLL